MGSFSQRCYWFFSVCGDVKMTKNDIEKMVQRVDKSIDSKLASSIVDLVFDVIRDAVKSGRRAEFRKFGSFSPHFRSEYSMVNPMNGKNVVSRERKLMRFRAAQILNNKINNYSKDEVVK